MICHSPLAPMPRLRIRSAAKRSLRPDTRLRGIGRIVGVDARSPVVAMSKPFLDCSERGTGSRHAGPEGVPEVMEPHGAEVRSLHCGFEVLVEL
jgi:hypothetical protein